MGQATETNRHKLASATGAHLRAPGEWESALRVETQTTHAPHNVVKAEGLSVFVGRRCLLSDTELKLAEACHTAEVETPRRGTRSVKHGTCYGLVGPNGCGKTTLLSLIAQRHLPVPSGWDVFHVSQHLPDPTESSIVQEVLGANAERAALLKLEASLEEELAGLAESGAAVVSAASARLVEAQREMARWEDAEKEVEDILLALGFRRSGRARHPAEAEPCLGTPIWELSGGWRMKIQLAKALWLRPKLLLLDEPTNHLDFEASEWLVGQLSRYPHTAVVVSHDVAFLHSVCRELLWVNERKLEPRDMVSQQDLARMQRRKAIKMDFTVPEGDVAADHGVSLHGVEFGYCPDGRSGNTHTRLWQQKGHVRFSGRSRSLLVGKNGSGKSSFLKLCAGLLAPTKGAVDRTPELKIGYYTQQMDEQERDPAESAAAYLVRECREALDIRACRGRGAGGRFEGETGASAHDQELQQRLFEQARGVLSDFGFEGDLAVGVPVQRLSGGQKACLKLAVLSLQPAHILLLDEPTNHLDAEACEALATGLSKFQGGIVVVTHDELLMYRLVQCNWAESELFVCQDGALRCLKDVGAHCLKTLRSEVRDAERAAPVASASSQRPRTAPKRHQAPGQANAEPAPGNSGRVTTITRVTPGVPPWLARAPARRERPRPPETADLPHGQRGLSSVAPEETMATLEHEAEAHPAEQPIEATAPAGPSSVDGATCRGEGRGGGTHSRLRKDLINLNKAVAKWQKQMENGAMSLDEAVQRIRTSAAARQLRASHDDEFDEESFVRDTLARGRVVPEVPRLRRGSTPIGGG